MKNHEIADPVFEGYMSQEDIHKMERKLEEWGIDVDTVIAIVEVALKEIGK